MTPKTIGAFGVGMTALGALQGAIADYYSAVNERGNLRRQASVSDQNAAYAEEAAQAAVKRGARSKQARQLATAQLKSTQRTTMAGNGIDLAGKSAQRILATTDLMGEVDALTIDQNTLEEKWSMKREATNFRNEARFARAGASGINPGGRAASSLLGSSGTVASRWYQWSKES